MMKKCSIIVMALLMAGQFLFAQDKKPNVWSILKTAEGKEVETSMLMIKNSDIKAVTMLNVNEMKARFGTERFEREKPTGCIIITLKPDFEILTYQKLLDFYRIKESARSLPVKINGITILDKDKIYASKRAVKSLKVKDNICIEIVSTVN